MAIPKPKIKDPTIVVNIKDSYDVYIGRPSIFGNPYKLSHTMDRYKAIELFRVYFLDRVNHDPQFYLELKKLKGKKLGCYCKPLACHGDIIAKYIDEEFKNG